MRNAKSTRRKGKQKQAGQGKISKIEKMYGKDVLALSTEDAFRLAHELQIHQDELQAQNEELRRAQLEADAIKRKYHDLFEFAPFGFFSFDRSGHIREVNQTGSALLKQNVQSLKHRKFDTFLTPESEKIFNQFLCHAYGSMEKTNCELELSNNCSRLFVEGTARYAEESDEYLIRAAVLDITERAQAARTRDSLLREACEAKNEAEHANRAKDQFLAMISHELRTPLTATLAWLGILKTGEGSEPLLSKGFEVISRTTWAQVRLVDDLLDISRIVSGKMTIDMIRSDLRLIANDATESVRATANQKQITLVLLADEDQYVLMGDPQRLTQIVFNLLSNAIKFTPEGGRVELRLQRKGDTAVISVADTGIGIPQDALQVIFDRFHQVDSSITRQYKGMGLGLTIAKFLAEAHGGTIIAESPGLNCGSTFTFSVPLIPVPLSVERMPSKEKWIAPSDHLMDLGWLQILIVEDDEDFSEYLVIALESLKATVRVVHSMEMAITEFEQFSPNLLLIDIGLPDQNGYELIKWIRKRPIERGGGVPAIALTAYARNEDRTQALVNGFNVHLSKPVDFVLLASKIVNLMDLECHTDNSSVRA